MAEPDWWSYVVVVVVSMGFGVIGWSLRLWRRPNALSPDSLMYRHFYLTWYVWLGGDREETGRLTERQIKCFAIGGVAVGVVAVLASILPAVR